MIFNKKTLVGICSSFFLLFYGIFRITVEHFREPDIQVGYLFKTISTGSLLSFIMILAGLYILIKIKRNDFN